MSNIHANGWELKQALSAANTTVWTLDLARIRNKIRREPGLRALLGPLERARGAQYANTALSELYIAAHVGLRTVLIERCGTKVAGLEFAITESGRPFLPGAPDFNISRSGSIGLVAISDVSRIGVDIEQMREVVIDDWPTRYPALRLFATGAKYGESAEFFQGWVRLEAWCKRHALALGPVLDSDENEFLQNLRELGAYNPASELTQLDVPTGYLAWCACDLGGGIIQRSLDL